MKRQKLTIENGVVLELNLPVDSNEFKELLYKKTYFYYKVGHSLINFSPNADGNYVLTSRSCTKHVGNPATISEGKLKTCYEALNHLINRKL
jgi:hypothetical protein